MTKETMYRIVTEEEAQQEPYPWVYVEEDGSARELTADEREYLQEPFLPYDGGRPYVKRSYGQRDGAGRMCGFCARKSLPRMVRESVAPANE